MSGGTLDMGSNSGESLPVLDGTGAITSDVSVDGVGDDSVSFTQGSSGDSFSGTISNRAGYNGGAAPVTCPILIGRRHNATRARPPYSRCPAGADVR